MSDRKACSCGQPCDVCRRSADLADSTQAHFDVGDIMITGFILGLVAMAKNGTPFRHVCADHRSYLDGLMGRIADEHLPKVRAAMASDAPSRVIN